MKKYLVIWAVMVMYVMAPVLAQEQNDIKVDFSIDPKPKVGIPSDLKIAVINATTGELLTDVKIGVEILIVEESVQLFSGEFYSPDGVLEMIYHFQDASEHTINLKISPTGESNLQFNPIIRTYLVEVEPPEPPTKVWFKTWLFLMGMLFLGIGIGILGVKVKRSF